MLETILSSYKVKMLKFINYKIIFLNTYEWLNNA